MQLLEGINQLSVLRESNATLRSESERHAKRSRELDLQLRKLKIELDPLQEQVQVAKAELEARDAQIASLQNEVKGWQERNAQLLTKVCDSSLQLAMTEIFRIV